MTNQHHNRITCIFIFFCCVCVLLIINLYFLQIYNHSFYSQLGANQYHIKISQLPTRAAIFDRSGHYLALNKESVSAFIVPYHVTQPDTLCDILQEKFPHAYSQWNKKKNTSFMFIARKLTSEQIEYIKQKKHPDIKLLYEPNRYYPIACCAPIIGITDIDNHGVMGAEYYYNTMMSGTASTSFLEKDARSGYFYFSKNNTVNGFESTSLNLTIDSRLQFLSHQVLVECLKEFNAQEGSVIIINPDNGDVITMACAPHFNPNASHTLCDKDTKNKPMVNAYEMGSVMKVFAALAALQEQVVTPDELIDCKNTKTTYLDGRRINTVKEHGVIPFWQVVACSNNIGIAIVAKRLQEKLYTHYKQFGFGVKTGIALPGESAGFINPVKNWSKQSIISLSYGYEITTTLLQQACAFCLIAHNGHPVKPRINMADDIVIGHKLYSDENIALIKNILKQTTVYGTAQRARIKGYTIMSKTGTANMLVDGVYQSDHNIYTCSGILQHNEYQRVIAVSIKNAQKKDLYASTVAAPLFEKIAQKLIIHDRVMLQ